MKNFQKTIIAGLAFVALFATSFANAELVKRQPQTSLYAGNTQCDGGTFDQVMYAGSTNHEMIDTLSVVDPSYTSYLWQLRSDGSNPDKYTWFSSYNVISNAITIPSMAYYSQGKPHNVNTVVVMGVPTDVGGAKITSDIPSTYKRSDIAAQVVYHVYRIGYLYKEGEQEMQYLDYNNLGAHTQIYKYGKTGSPVPQADNECLNIHIGFCGDGILDNGTKEFSENIDSPLNGGEECDDGAANGTSSSDCTVSCTKKQQPPVVPPKCVSSYEGDLYNTNYPTALLNADMILCNPGEVTNFVGPVEPNRTYTWKCSGSEGTTPDNCNAKELWCGDGKVQKAYGEECDPNETNPNWGGKECSPSCKLTDKKIYDLALTKTLVEEGKTYKPGDVIYYRITIYNQGDYTARNIEITDYIPYGLILDDDKWTQEGNVAKRTITSEILPGTSVSSITIKFKIDPNFNGTEIINGAEISKDNSNEYNTEDIDSNPDNNPNDDCIIPYKHIITGNGKAYTEEGKACDESTDEDDHDYVPIYFEEQPGEPTIDKNLLGDKNHKYKVGELVGFKMVFKNTTNKAVIHAKIKDYLPLNLEYVSSEIHGVSPILSGLYKIGGQTVLEYSGFDLAPNQEGYIIMTGKVLDSNLDNRVNNVCIYGNDQKNDDGSDKSYVCDNDKYDIGGRSIKIEKSVNKSEVALGDIIEYTIKVTALDGEYPEYKITDYLPKGISFYSYDLNSASSTVKYVEMFSTGVTSTGLDLLNWNYSFPNGFKKGDTLTIKFKAKITELYKTYSTNVACILPPGEKEQCDKVDVKPNIVLNIKKYVSNSVNGPWYDDTMTLENGKTAYFKIVVDGADDPLQSFVIEDDLDNSKLLFKNESWSLANNAFTGTIKFGTYNTGVKDDYKLTPSVSTGVAGHTKLSWDVYMGKGDFMSGDVFEAIFMAEKKADEKNIACVYYDKLGEETHECDPAEVKNPTGNLLTIKKYVSKNSDWKAEVYNDADTESAALSLNSKSSVDEKNVIFKMVVKDAKVSFTGFTVKDSIDTTMYKLLKDDTLKLSDNAFTGIMKKGSKNTTPFEYVITPKITNDKDLEWNVVMKSGSVFMEGDTLTVYFKAQKLRDNNDKNTACVYDYSGKINYACDPAYVKRACEGCGSSGGGGGGGGGGGSKCGDGYKNGIEYCDWGGSEKVIHKGDPLFKNSTSPTSTYEGEWTCTKSCTLIKKSTGEVPKCFNVQNGSISIMKGEMLPFYWNMAGEMGTHPVSDRVEYVKDNFIQKCSSSDAGKIELESMMCEFIVYGPQGKVYEFSANCAESNDWTRSNSWTNFKNNYPIITSWISQNSAGWLGGSLLNHEGDTKNVFETLDNYWKVYPTLLPVSSKLIIEKFGTPDVSVGNRSVTLNKRVSNITDFGEYKISLNRVKYRICSGEGTSSTEEIAEEPVCEVDFAVTDHYLVQKSPYGEIRSTTNLKSYKNIDGGALFEGNKEDKPADYSVPADLATSLDTFINKYYANSVVVKSSSKCGGEIRKVKGKSIYFIGKKGDTTSSEVILSDNENVSCISTNVQKPYTLIAVSDKINIRIMGSLYSNAMIMTKGNIIFDAEGFKADNGWNPTACNGNIKKYGHAGQMVKGIFYAGKGFLSEHDKWNTEKSNKEWCNYGNLHIKGIAIGDLSNVVKNRRSELYTWFYDGCDAKNPSTDSKCKNRRDVVLNGASVLIEYNPDLWGNLPPGAEDFNKALEIYRK